MAKEPLGLTKPRAASVASDKRVSKKTGLLGAVKAIERKLNDDYRTGGDAVIDVHNAFRAFRDAVLKLPG